MTSMLSSTDWMKQALPCGYSYCVAARSACAGLAIVKPIASAGVVADAVLVIETDVEPDRRIERAVLVHAKPGQFVVKNFALGLGEITILDAPIGNRAADAVDELTHRGFALGRVLLAVKIFGNDDFGRQHRPGLRHFDVFLFENDFAGVVGDFRRALFPFDLVEGTYLRVTEDPF